MFRLLIISCILSAVRFGLSQDARDKLKEPSSDSMFFMAPENRAAVPAMGTCGVSTHYPGTARIVNGNLAGFGTFPWTAALVHKTYKQYCAGTILSSEYILTAAHCVVGSLSLRDVVANVSVIVGARNLAAHQDSDVYQIGQIALYPGYEPRGWKNDLALIKLKRPIRQFNEETKAICLPKRSLEDLMVATKNASCFLAGWGYLQEKPGAPIIHTTKPKAGGSTKLGSGSDALLFARLNFVPLKLCQDNYYQQAVQDSGKPEYVLDSMVCAASGHLNDLANPQGTCMGDSGGGLVCQEEDRTWAVYGIASWRFEECILRFILKPIVHHFSGGCARKDLPSIFTNVYKLKSYVERIMNFRPTG